nr:hypothetical protein [Providencia rettgeri]
MSASSFTLTVDVMVDSTTPPAGKLFYDYSEEGRSPVIPTIR